MITSRQNQWFRRFRDAIREHDREIVIEGPKMVRDAIAAGWRPIAVAFDVALAVEGSAEMLPFATELFKMLTGTRTSQGMAGLFERPEGTLARILARRDSVIVALDDVQDPGNVGTMVRLAAAFDAAGVLITPGCADPLGQKAIRSSAGAILEVPVARVTHEQLLAAAAQAGLPLFVADGSGARVPPPATGAILVFGNEGSGVSALLAEGATKIAIPMSPRVESLNVAASAAILLSRSYDARTSTTRRAWSRD
jgi:RNA methyltransferase, TrmH family